MIALPAQRTWKRLGPWIHVHYYTHKVHCANTLTCSMDDGDNTDGDHLFSGYSNGRTRNSLTSLCSFSPVATCSKLDEERCYFISCLFTDLRPVLQNTWCARPVCSIRFGASVMQHWTSCIKLACRGHQTDCACQIYSTSTSYI